MSEDHKGKTRGPLVVRGPQFEKPWSNTTCYSFSSGVYYTLSDMFRPFYNGRLQASLLGGGVNTTVIRNI
jgi:hypothetical protein